MKKEEILKAFNDDFEIVAKDKLAMNDLKAKYLGKKGILTKARKNIDFSNLSSDDRKRLGFDFNEIKNYILNSLKSTNYQKSNSEEIAALDFDLSIPGKSNSRVGTIHPLIATQMEVEHIFHSMGFQILTGNEVVSEYDNFDSLNIASDHPARDMHDTFWLENNLVLRTHTSSMQNVAMKTLGVPLKAIYPGRCFRNEAIDMTHENTFYQMEGMFIDKNVSVANLIGVMKELLDQVFQKNIEVRLRPGYFPFVEPGFELDFKANLNGEEKWIELMPCGMIHPVVLENGGIDPNEYSGFAFGLGLSRLAMLKFGINDVRLFNQGDIRFYEQFTAR